jgi:hypothetical protein
LWHPFAAVEEWAVAVALRLAGIADATAISVVDGTVVTSESRWHLFSP